MLYEKIVNYKGIHKYVGFTIMWKLKSLSQQFFFF